MLIRGNGSEHKWAATSLMQLRTMPAAMSSVILFQGERALGLPLWRTLLTSLEGKTADHHLLRRLNEDPDKHRGGSSWLGLCTSGTGADLAKAANVCLTTR
jgi:hypothetical protein